MNPLIVISKKKDLKTNWHWDNRTIKSNRCVKTTVDLFSVFFKYSLQNHIM